MEKEWIHKVGHRRRYVISDLNPPKTDMDEIAKEDMARELAKFLLDQGIFEKRVKKDKDKPYEEWEYEVSNLWVIIPPKEERKNAPKIIGWLREKIQRKRAFDLLKSTLADSPEDL